MNRHFKRNVAVLALASGLWVGTAQASVILGTFEFDSALFGDTLLQSDGGAFAANNWLNVVNADPGSPGYLTGANFDTGIANIGLGAAPVYTIGYSTPIFNTGGAYDLGVVTARFSVTDTITMEVSTDGGVTFSGPLNFGPGLAQATGVGCSYFYAGGGPFGCDLFVTPIELSSFGLAEGASINAIRITGSPELDLIRVAGFANGEVPVPEPTTLALFGAALIPFALRRRRFYRSN
jgi:hypothetical protein